jgi:hypothetical protein
MHGNPSPKPPAQDLSGFPPVQRDIGRVGGIQTKGDQGTRWGKHCEGFHAVPQFSGKPTEENIHNWGLALGRAHGR